MPSRGSSNLPYDQKKHPEACKSQGGWGPTPLPEGSALRVLAKTLTGGPVVSVLAQGSFL
jgi:hypothetical protein